MDVTTTARPGRLPLALRLAPVTALAGLATGAATQHLQGVLPGPISSLANSAAPWALVGFVLARRSSTLVGAIGLATVALSCAEIGYVLATAVDGGANGSSTVRFWLVAAALAAAPVAVAATCWDDPRPLALGLAHGIVGGILVGEGSYGLAAISDTTDARYWTAELGLGVAVVLATAMRSPRARRRSATAVAVTLAAAAGATILVAASTLG